MDFAFEVKDSDLMGRIGLLKVGRKTIETPYLFPVIHPVNQLISTKELESMGFGGIMTNSYIIGTRRREEALEKGVHSMLGYDGVVMTDSGGYQVLEYGDLGVEYSQVAAFQADIGSELAVTLDRPTGFSESEGYAKGTVEYSLRNAEATLKEYGGRDTVWVGPVQGGLFPGLVDRSARSLVAAGFQFLALGSPVQVMENYRFAELTKMIVATRRAVPYAMPLHLFGAGHPLTMALAVALGCDTFDSASYVLFARGGRYMTDRGVSRLETMKYLPCSCPVCSGTTVTELQELERREMVRELSLHNLHMLRKELETCKQAVSEGRLWDLVRERAAAHPRLLEAFHSMAATGSLIEDGTPPLKLKGLLLRDLRDADRPEVVAARRRLHESVRRGSTQAVLVDAEWSVPTGKTGLIAGLPKGADVYRLHPLLGPYPVELEFVYPFTQTVAASSLKETDGLAEAASDLRRLGYRRVYVARQGKGGGLRVRQLRSRRRSKASSPSAPSSSARPR